MKNKELYIKRYNNMYMDKLYIALCDNKKCYKFKNCFRYNIKDILDNLIINYYQEQNNVKIYYGYVNKCESYLEIIKKKEYVPVIKFHCEVTKNNVKKIEKYDNTDKNMITTNILKLNTYLESIGGTILYKTIREENIYITVEMSEYPILKNHINEIKKYIKKGSRTKLYNIIQNFTFRLYVMDKKINTILDLTLDIVDNIKRHIKNFIKKILGDDFDELLLNCNVMQYENIYVSVLFTVDNIKNEWKYYSYYDRYYIGNNIDIIYDKLSRNERITYYDTFYIRENDLNNKSYIKRINSFCRTDPIYMSFKESDNEIKKGIFNKKKNKIKINNITKINVYNQLVTKVPLTIDIENTLEDEKHNFFFNNLAVMYYYYKNQSDRTYDKINSLLMMDKTTKKVYNVTIECITSIITKLNNNFREKIHKRIMGREHMIYKTNNRGIYISKMPGYFGIKIEEVKKIDTMENRFFVVETRKLYDEYVLKKINDQMLEYNIILFSIILNRIKIKEMRYYENGIKKMKNKEEYYYIKNNIFFNYMLSRSIIKNREFYITNKYDFGDSYVLWYLPEFNINDEEKYIKVLSELCELSREYKDPKLESYKKFYSRINESETIKKFIIENTNYTRVFMNKNFIYNIRHLGHDKRKYINKLLFKFLREKYREKMKIGFEEAYYNKYYVYCHYPNAGIYNIFHLQIINTKELRKASTRNVDVYDRYIVNSNKRFFLWDKIKDLSFENKDILIDFQINMKNILIGNNEYVKNVSRIELIENMTDIK